jgi:hypothetical protein
MTSQARHNRRKRDMLREIKFATGCQECEWRPRRAKSYGIRWLHFHHRDPETKSFDISNQAHSRSIPELLAEVAKCDVLCEDCHPLTETYGRRNGS